MRGSGLEGINRYELRSRMSRYGVGKGYELDKEIESAIPYPRYFAR